MVLSQTLFSVLRGHNKLPQTQLKRQKCIVSEFRRPDLRPNKVLAGSAPSRVLRDCFHFCCACWLADNLPFLAYRGFTKLCLPIHTVFSPSARLSLQWSCLNRVVFKYPFFQVKSNLHRLEVGVLLLPQVLLFNLLAVCFWKQHWVSWKTVFFFFQPSKNVSCLETDTVFLCSPCRPVLSILTLLPSPY